MCVTLACIAAEAGMAPVQLTPEQAAAAAAAKREAALKAAMAKVGKMSAKDRAPAKSVLHVVCP